MNSEQNSQEANTSKASKKTYVLLALFVVILLAFVFLILRGDEDSWICRQGTWVKHGNPAAPAPSTACPGGLSQNQQPLANIAIEQPSANQSITSPVTIKGLARVFENTLQVRVKDANNKVLAETTVMANSADTGLFGPYQIDLAYSVPETESGSVEAFQYSAQNGSETDKISVPVVFGDYQAQTVKVFFSNSILDPNITDCQKVFSVDRKISKTLAVAEAALTELLKGPTESEKSSGYFSSINSGVTLKKITIEDGVATAEFDSRLEEAVGGSCRVTNIRSQITETLKQFPTVTSVVISIDGRTEDILQP